MTLPHLELARSEPLDALVLTVNERSRSISVTYVPLRVMGAARTIPKNTNTIARDFIVGGLFYYVGT